MTRLNAEQWREISPHLDRALDLDPANRERFLVELADSRPELVTLLRELLATQENNAAAQFLEQSLVNGPEPMAGELVGAYTLEALLGSGGMGSVWLAQVARSSLR